MLCFEGRFQVFYLLFEIIKGFNSCELLLYFSQAYLRNLYLCHHRRCWWTWVFNNLLETLVSGPPHRKTSIQLWSQATYLCRLKIVGNNLLIRCS